MVPIFKGDIKCCCSRTLLIEMQMEVKHSTPAAKYQTVRALINISASCCWNYVLLPWFLSSLVQNSVLALLRMTGHVNFAFLSHWWKAAGNCSSRARHVSHSCNETWNTKMETGCVTEIISYTALLSAPAVIMATQRYLNTLLTKTGSCTEQVGYQRDFMQKSAHVHVAASVWICTLSDMDYWYQGRHPTG